MAPTDGAAERVDQIVFRWDSGNASGTTGFGPVAWSGGRDEAEALFRSAGTVLRASGEETRPALIRLQRRTEAMLIRRIPWTDPGGGASTICHALVGPSDLLDPSLCLGLHGWTWEGADLPLAAVRGGLPEVREDALIPAAGLGQHALDTRLPEIADELTGAVAELLRRPEGRFTLLDERGDTALPVLWGLYSMFGELTDLRWTFATHDTAELRALRFVFVGRWAGAASSNTDRHRADPRERAGDEAESLAARLVDHHLRGVAAGADREYAVCAALRHALTRPGAPLMATARGAVTRLDRRYPAGGGGSTAAGGRRRTGDGGTAGASGASWVSGTAGASGSGGSAAQGVPPGPDGSAVPGGVPGGVPAGSPIPGAAPGPEVPPISGGVPPVPEGPPVPGGVPSVPEDPPVPGDVPSIPEAPPVPGRSAVPGGSPVAGVPRVREAPSGGGGTSLPGAPGVPPAQGAPQGSDSWPPADGTASPGRSGPRPFVSSAEGRGSRSSAEGRGPAGQGGLRSSDPGAEGPAGTEETTARPYGARRLESAAERPDPSDDTAGPDRSSDAVAEPRAGGVLGSAWAGPVETRRRYRGRRKRVRRETGLEGRLVRADGRGEVREAADEASDGELLLALRDRGRPHLVTTVLIQEVVRRFPAWGRGLRRELRDLVIAEEYFVGRAHPDDRVAAAERAAEAAELHAWAVRPMLGGAKEGDGAVERLAVVLARFRTSPDPAARAAFRRIVGGERPGLPESVWRTLVLDVRLTSPNPLVPHPAVPPSSAPAPKASSPFSAPAPRASPSSAPVPRASSPSPSCPPSPPPAPAFPAPPSSTDPPTPAARPPVPDPSSARQRSDGRVAYAVLGCALFLLVSLVVVIFVALLTP
ncbi:hypothetical protein [Streptomyces sp. NPDC058084]|uniref:hypothetical protein n=1 Tax=Streptomyces sp. NPDC058084 TaxID=3346333 RepID=UPI0036EE094D